MWITLPGIDGLHIPYTKFKVTTWEPKIELYRDIVGMYTHIAN